MDGPVLTYEHFQIETDSSGAPVVLATTGQGKTFRAFDTRLRKTVALKVVARELITDENVRKRFLNEARAAAAISHPNIARVIHLCPPDAPEFYYAMELVDGESLAQRIAEHGRMPVAQALTTLRPITDLLVALGNQRLVHRDIQPANLILSKDAKGASTVKLINFGLAKSIGTQAGLLEVVHTAELRATDVYHLSPEQIQGETVDARADFYSLGVTLWTAIVGKPPFVGSPYDVNEGHLHGEVNWADLPPTTTPARALLEALLAKSPQDRPADAAALCALWEEALRSLESAPGSSQIDDTALPTITEPTPAAKAPHLIPLNVPPAGCSKPSESGFLAENTSDGEIVFVRPIPHADTRSVRGELLAAANASLTRPNPALLNVCEIDDVQIVSEWRRGVTVGDLLASRPSALPRKVAGSWLRTVAQAVDWTRDNGIERANFSLGNWVVEFLDLKETESPLERAARDPETWGPTAISLDPLAGFDPIILLASADPEQTLPAGRFAALTSPASYLSAFARSAERLLEPDRAEPLGAPARSLLTDAIAGQSKFATAREWVATLLGDEIAGVKTSPAPSPAATTIDRNAATAIGPVVVPQVRVNLPSASPVNQPATSTAASPPPPARSPANRRLTPVLSPLALRSLLIAAAVLVVSLSIWGIAALRSKPQSAENGPTPDPTTEVRRLLDLARGNLDQARYDAASDLLTQARTAAGDLAGKQNLVTEITALAERLAAAKKPTATAAPASAQEVANAITKATLEQPFENKLGMQFVPVPIIGGETGGRRVLFAVTETRVREFEKFARQKWREAGASDENPAVAVISVEITRFCRWLEQQASLPAGWHYRLPTDHEWSCAAGIGKDENPTESGTSKGTKLQGRYAWGKTWPPPAGAGNFADLAARRGGSPDGIKDYDDKFAELAPVKQFTPNAFGLYDLAGNAAEWCYDAAGFYLRGGAFNSPMRRDLDLAARANQGGIDNRMGHAGFRLVISDRIPAYPKQTTAAVPADIAQGQAGASGASAAAAYRYGDPNGAAAARGGNPGLPGGGATTINPAVTGGAPGAGAGGGFQAGVMVAPPPPPPPSPVR